ncbi:MAG: SH3 domain-containing protein [Gammaproteobacteria bacterium]|nr:SH3 domain-containing protein [Gammaproteobacteria bacterium]
MKRTLTAITVAAALAAPLAAPSAAHAQGILNMDRNEMLGSLIGASVGALLGSRVGDGDNELVGAALGGVGGYFVGKRFSGGNAWQGQNAYGYDRGYDGRYERHRGGYDRDDGYHRRHDRRTLPIQQIDQVFRARVDSHVRSGPAPGYRSVDVLRRGSQVHVVGRVDGANWYMVSRRGRVIGYVYAPLLYPDHDRDHRYGRR